MAQPFSASYFCTVALVLSMVLCAHAFPHKYIRSAEVFPSGPSISSITPSNSHVGDTVVIKGTGFDAINAVSNKVFFVNKWDGLLYDSIQAEILAVTDTTISAIVPPGATQGTISVKVSSQYATFVNGVYYNVIPTLESFIPDTGYIGDTITITGTGFNAWHQTTNYVWFTNGSNTASISATPTEIKVIVPRSTTTGPVTVFTQAPHVTSTFNFNILPALSYLEQTSGEVGQDVTIYGTGFDPDEASDYHLTFNGTPAVINAVYSTIIQTTVPARATSGPIQLVYNDSVAKGSGIIYTVIQTEPIVSSYTPNSGVIGTSVVINGSGFDQGGPALTIGFSGGVAAEIDSFTNVKIYTKVPLGAQPGPIAVKAGGRLSSGGPGFRVIETILDMQPRKAHVGDTIVVTGKGFVKYYPDYYKIILTNSNPSIYPVSVTDTTLKFVVPANASSSFVPLIVSDYYLYFNTYLPRLSIIPVITRIEPDTVIAGREMEITMYGTGIRRSLQSRFEVSFRNNVVQRLTFNNTDTSFSATVPPTVASGTVPVSLRIDDLLSDVVNLVVLPDTFPYTPLQPKLFGETGVTTTSITCVWSKCYRALGYILDVTTDNFKTFVPGYKSLVMTDTSVMLSGLEPGTGYEFRLRPYSDTDTAAYKGYVYVLTVPLPPVAAPVKKLSETSFLCSWSSVKGAYGYSVEASIDYFETIIPYYATDTVALLSITGGTGRLPSSLRYRVRAVSISGMSEYSNVIALVEEELYVMVYPNPSKDQVLIAGLHDDVKETHLIDANGKVTNVSLSNMGDNTFSFDIRELPSGQYFLQLVLNQKAFQKVVQVKFIKQ